jgi:hypothetical protein
MTGLAIFIIKLKIVLMHCYWYLRLLFPPLLRAMEDGGAKKLRRGKQSWKMVAGFGFPEAHSTDLFFSLELSLPLL